MVYDSTKDAYEKFMQALPTLSEDLNSSEEYLPQEVLNKLVVQCKEKFFNREMIPPYDEKDVRHILKYYAQKGECPTFYTFDKIDKNKLDVSKVAQKIIADDMPPSSEKIYLNNLWEKGDKNILRLFFGKKNFFFHLIDVEKRKILYPEQFGLPEDSVTPEQKDLKTLPLYEIEKYNPELARKLREGAFEKAKVENSHIENAYKCAGCGKIFFNKRFLQVDHIKPMNKGGLSVPENLQILCRSCNARKNDNDSVPADSDTSLSGGNVYVDDTPKHPIKLTPEQPVENILPAEKDTPKNIANFNKDAKFFKDALQDKEGRYLVKNYIATDNCEMHMLVLKNFKQHRLFNYTAKKLYRENKAVKITPTELEEMIKKQKS